MISWIEGQFVRDVYKQLNKFWWIGLVQCTVYIQWPRFVFIRAIDRKVFALLEKMNCYVMSYDWVILVFNEFIWLTKCSGVIVWTKTADTHSYFSEVKGHFQGQRSFLRSKVISEVKGHFRGQRSFSKSKVKFTVKGH